MSYQLCVEPDVEDEKFLRFAGIEALQLRLSELYGDEKGNSMWYEGGAKESFFGDHNGARNKINALIKSIKAERGAKQLKKF